MNDQNEHTRLTGSFGRKLTVHSRGALVKKMSAIRTSRKTTLLVCQVLPLLAVIASTPFKTTELHARAEAYEFAPDPMIR